MTTAVAARIAAPRRWTRLVALCTLLGLASAPARAELTDSERIRELERKVGVLVRELEDARLGGAADTARYVSRLGLGPAASKVYAARGVSIGGYGEMLLQRFDGEREDGVASGRAPLADFLRQIVYVGYAFGDDLHFNSEVEIEHAGVFDEAGVEVDPMTGEGSAELSGEVVLEFAYLDWRLRPEVGVRAGLLLAPLGWVNELHEPPVFIGARRPEVEQRIIPTTWRGNGAGVFGELPSGVAYRAYVMEPLDGSGFSATGGIRDGRQSGSESVIHHPAVAARVDLTRIAGLTVGASAFAGRVDQSPAIGGEPRLTLVDAHASVQWRSLEARALYAIGSLTDAGALSDALGLAGAARLGERSWGGYVEASWDVLQAMRPGSRFGLRPYARYERYDTQDDVPGGSENPAAERTVTTVGLAALPHPNVVLKLDRQDRSNEASTETSQWNAAIGYLF